MRIPLVDLKAQYFCIKYEIDEAISRAIEDSAFIKGKYVECFEENFARAIGVRNCIGVGNGTDAIQIALKVLGIGQGDEVITAANTFIATSEAITATGARAVFADVDPSTYTIAPDAVEVKISERTKAIVPVHLYGHPADMDAISSIAKKHSIRVVEDAAQAHLSKYRGRSIGTFGVSACYSFYPGKNLGAYGDAGAIVTDDDDVAKRIRMYANHGRTSKYDHEFEGMNSRMDGIQGAILDVKLCYLRQWTEKRRHIAACYRQFLANIPGVELPIEGENVKHVYHLFVVRVKEREGLQKHLTSKGISTGIHYPIALPNLTAYRYLGHSPSDFPVASQYQGEILSLPMYPELTEEQIQFVSDQIKEFFNV